MRKAAVLGGAGFIGSQVAKELIDHGYYVHAIDVCPEDRFPQLQGFPNRDRIRYFQGNIEDYSFLKQAVNGAEYIFHLADAPFKAESGNEISSYYRANFQRTLNVLQAGKENGVTKVIYASSSAVYGNNNNLPHKEDMAPNPVTPYAASKLMAETAMKIFADYHGLATIILRYFNVYGPKQNPESPFASVVPKFIYSINEGKPPIIFGDGTQTRDFVFVKDVARANILAAESDACGVYNIASGQSTSLNQLAGLIAGLAGKPQLEPCYQPARPGDVLHSAADITRAARAFAYRPQYSLEEGLSALLT